MMRLTLMVMIAALISGVAYAQGPTPNMVGNWRGTLSQGKGLRLVLQVAKVDTGGGQAVLYSIDQSEQGIPVSSLTLQGSNLKFAIPAIACAYEGTVSADGGSIQGALTQGKNSVPFFSAPSGRRLGRPIPPRPPSTS